MQLKEIEIPIDSKLASGLSDTQQVSVTRLTGTIGYFTVAIVTEGGAGRDEAISAHTREKTRGGRLSRCDSGRGKIVGGANN